MNTFEDCGRGGLWGIERADFSDELYDVLEGDDGALCRDDRIANQAYWRTHDCQICGSSWWCMMTSTINPQK